MLPILDMWTDVVAVPGRRTSGSQAGHFALTGPGWTGKLPAGVTPIPLPTPYAWTIGRTQTNGPSDYEAVHGFQDGLRLSLLSDLGGEPRPAAFAFDPTVDMNTPPLTQVNNMSAEEFFPYAFELLKMHPPHVTDSSILLQMERIGLKVGVSLDFSALPTSVKSALSEGARAGLDEMGNYATTRTKPRDGWSIHPGLDHPFP